MFTYVDKDVIESQRHLPALNDRTDADALANTGISGLTQPTSPAYLAARGLELIDDLGAADYRTRYLGGPGEGYEFYRVAIARVVGTHRKSDEA